MNSGDRIMEHLLKMASEDENFETKLHSEEKNFEECLKYIDMKADEFVKSNKPKHGDMKGCYLDNDMVHGWAVHYYDEPKEIIDEEMKKFNPRKPNGFVPPEQKASSYIPVSKPVVEKPKSNQLSLFDL